MANFPTCSQPLLEQLEVLRYMSRDKKAFGIYSDRPYRELTKDFERVVKLRNLGRELKPGSYKFLKLTHLNHGTDSWKILFHMERSSVTINKDNWSEFCYYVRSLMAYSPNSASTLMHKYPHVRLSDGLAETFL